MTLSMHTLNALLFFLTLLLCGAYAGMALFCQIGVLPTMRNLDTATFVTVWRILDRYMARSMPPYKVTLLALTLASSISLFVQHQTSLARLTAASFLLTLAALVLTVWKQLPLNTQMSSLPANTDRSTVVALLDRTVKNFGVRLVLAVVAFAVLCLGAVAYPIA